MVQVSLAYLQNYICGLAGRTRSFEGLQPSGLQKYVYKLTEKEWEAVEKDVDHRGRPIFVRVDLVPTTPEEETTEAADSGGEG